MSHPFRFGVMLSERFAPDQPLPRDRAGWAEKARRIEAAGYSTLLMVDHFASPLAPLTSLMAAADATRHLRVGTMVLAADYRHPMILAKEAATVDLLSDGRLELGLGAGWLAADYRMAGIPFDPPAVRIDRLEEVVQILRCLLAGEPTAFHGRHLTIEAPGGVAQARQRPRVPMLVAGGGRKVLSVAARHADIVGVNLTIRGGAMGAALASSTVAATRERIGWIREAAGGRFEDLELNVSPLAVVTEDRASAAARLAPMFAQPPDQLLSSPNFLAGSVEQIVEDLQARREAYGFSYVVFTGGHEKAWRRWSPGWPAPDPALDRGGRGAPLPPTLCQAMNPLERYIVEEHIEDFNDGLISRRELLRRVTLMTGSVTAAASLLELMGCGSQPAGRAVSPSGRSASQAAGFATKRR
jgi:probable F420-dependent oxidoreductase